MYFVHAVTKIIETPNVVTLLCFISFFAYKAIETEKAKRNENILLIQ